MPSWWPKRKPKAPARSKAPERSDVREFIRHTVDVPLEFRTVEGEDQSGIGPLPPAATAPAPWETSEGRSVNVGFGGLAFASNYCPQAGDLIELRIPSVSPPFVATARVAWCRPEGGQYLIGVSFLDASDAFRSRMVQQVCSIENYRREMQEKEGRELTAQEASAEWIAKFANRFPAPGKAQ